MRSMNRSIVLVYTLLVILLVSSKAQVPPPVPSASPRTDPNVKPTNYDVPPSDPAALTTRSKLDLSTAKNAGLVAARVGDDIITVQEVVEAMRERLKEAPPEQANDPKVRLQVAPMVLDDLIDRALVLREAKAKFGKKKEALKTFNDMADAKWKEEEYPPLLRKYKVENEYALKRALELEGKNLQEMKEQYRKQVMFIEYLVISVRPKLSVSNPEMKKYYNRHLSDYKRGALITWREISIDIAKNKTPDLAKAKAETIHEGLKRGADFATLAMSQSDGPTAKDGGKWETAPGSIADKDVANAIETLPLNQISPILTNKHGYSIVVVEARREAGIAPYYEVQDQVRQKVFEEKKAIESQAFIQKLGTKTMVVTTVPGSRYAIQKSNPQ